MTKLQEEMLSSFEDIGGDCNDMAIAAAEVAKKYIEIAFYCNPSNRVQELCGMVTQEELKDRFFKDYGITE